MDQWFDRLTMIGHHESRIARNRRALAHGEFCPFSIAVITVGFTPPYATAPFRGHGTETSCAEGSQEEDRVKKIREFVKSQ